MKDGRPSLTVGVQLPLFKHGLPISQKLTSTSHKEPVYSGEHIHEYAFRDGTQVALFAHGEDSQKSMIS